MLTTVRHADNLFGISERFNLATWNIRGLACKEDEVKAEVKRLKKLHTESLKHRTTKLYYRFQRLHIILYLSCLRMKK
jgi:hypothetical protein